MANFFILYFDLEENSVLKYKTIIIADCKESAKEAFLSKSKRHFGKVKLKRVRVFHLNRFNYKGRCIPDFMWDYLSKIAYPNKRHILTPLPFDYDFFPQFENSLRDKSGKFLNGFVPWNKGLQLSFYKKDPKGRFTKSRDDRGRFLNGLDFYINGCNINHDAKEIS